VIRNNSYSPSKTHFAEAKCGFLFLPGGLPQLSGYRVNQCIKTISLRETGFLFSRIRSNEFGSPDKTKNPP
jgi:hypothetical protein